MSPTSTNSCTLLSRSPLTRSRAAQAEEAKEKRSALDIAVTEADPKSLFDEAIDAALCRKLESLGLIDADVDINVQRQVTLEKFKQSLQKKRFVPGRRAGAESRYFEASAKGKGKGKIKAVAGCFSRTLSKAKAKLIGWRQRAREKRHARRSQYTLGCHLLCLLRGAPMNALHSILSFGELAKTRLFAYSPEFEQTSAVPADVPWTLQWFLVHHSAKFRILSTAKPKLDWLTKDSKNAVNKLMWTLHLCKEGGILPQVRRPTMEYAECNKMQDTLEARWARHFRRTLLRLAAVPCTRPTGVANMYGLMKLAIKELERCRYNIVELDKDPGYGFVYPDSFVMLEQKALDCKHYEPYNWYSYSCRDMRRELGAIARKIGDFCDDSRVTANILSHCTNGILVAPLGVTIKSRKPPGLQTLRTIHKGLTPSLCGLSMWVSSILDEKLVQVSWIAKDSQQVRTVVKQLHFTASTVFHKYDIKDFFLSGEELQIATDVSADFDDPTLRHLLFRSLLCLLSQQIVISKTLDCLHRCKKGSGIGLVHSPSVSNYMFYIRVERALVSKGIGVMLWVRYHDDALVAYQDRSAGVSFFANLRKKAEPVFQLKCEKVASVNKTITFLDICISLQVPVCGGSCTVEASHSFVCNFLPCPVCYQVMAEISLHQSQCAL